MAYEPEFRGRCAQEPGDAAAPRIPVEDVPVGSGLSARPARGPEWLRIELRGGK